MSYKKGRDRARTHHYVWSARRSVPKAIILPPPSKNPILNAQVACDEFRRRYPGLACTTPANRGT